MEYKILIGICTSDYVRPQTVTSLIAARDTLLHKNVGVAVSIQEGGYKPYNMNRLVKHAQDEGFTHLMSIDNDMIFPSSGILRLLDADKDIIGANYNQRTTGLSGNEVIATIKFAGKDGKLISKEIPSQLFECWSLGLGFSLMKMSIFDKLEKPYFRDFESPEGEHHTEDVEFFTKCQKAGFKVWCNPTIEMGHIGKNVI